MKDIAGEAISFQLFYGLSPKDLVNVEIPPITEETPQFRDIQIHDVICFGARMAVQVKGLPELPLEELHIERLTVRSKTGIVCQNVMNSSFSQIRLCGTETPSISLDNCMNIKVDNLKEEA